MNFITISALLSVALPTLFLSTPIAMGAFGDRLRNRGAKEETPSATITRTIHFEDRDRTYLLYVPASYSKSKPTPVVFVFHGGRSSAEKMVGFSGFVPKADADGTILVYPEAIEENWNDGRNVESMTAQRENVDDVGLVAAILDELGKQYSIDKKRVYATGISNGGIMSQRLAVERSDIFAAIAPVAGSIAEPVAEKFAPKEPVSVIMFNGTDDPIVPFKGGAVSHNRGNVLSTEDTTKKWVTRDGCKGPKHDVLPDKDPEDKCTIESDTYTGGQAGTEVVLYTVKGGGHTWPGGNQYLPALLIGIASQDAKATDLIWDFFKKHPKP